LTEPGIRKAFLGGVAADEKKAVKAFVNLSENKSNALKKNPKVSPISLPLLLLSNAQARRRSDEGPG
jgi:hypothetical protein